jgi:hypothetical protein
MMVVGGITPLVMNGPADLPDGLKQTGTEDLVILINYEQAPKP